MENIYCNMYAGDYQNASESKTELHLRGQEAELHSNSCYYISEDLLLNDNSQFENTTENLPNALLQSYKPYDLENQNKERIVNSKKKMGTSNIRHLDVGNIMPLITARRDVSKDKKITQNEPVDKTKFTVRSNRISPASLSAPSILPSPRNQYLPEENNHKSSPKKDYKKEKRLIAPPATILNKVPKKVLSPSKERNQKTKSSQRSRNVNVKKRQDYRMLKVPVKRLYLMENEKIPFYEKNPIDLVHKMKHIPDRRNNYETDRYSSYSESDLRYIAEQENKINERNVPRPKFQHCSKQIVPRHSVNDNLKYISNALTCSNYLVPYDESSIQNHSKKSDSRFTTDSFLRKELSDFKEFLIYRRSQQRQTVSREPKIPTICIPENIEHQENKELYNGIQKNEHKNSPNECANEKQRKVYSYTKTKHVHTIRRPKVSEEELWKRFAQNFRRYASTKRYSGEVIPRKISTEWMSNMGVVGDLLTEKDADTEFKKAAGIKITMNMQEYKEFLITLTMKKKLPFYEIYRRMCGI